CTVTPWESDVIYSQPGTRISHEGYLYENKYYIKGEAPSLDAPAWGVWEFKGPCN
ncbi:MAG: carbohydrate-binding protein, partial [Psychromonas sp.]|nr:carbohydrate-binding protein [Psychromonas sp.]